MRATLRGKGDGLEMISPNVERRARGAARIERLLAAAETVIVEHGVGGLTLSRVAKRAQTAQGSLYQFFASRDDLLIALHERYATRLEAVAHQATAAFTDLAAMAKPGDLVRLLLDPMAAFYLKNPAYGEIRRDETRANPTTAREDQVDALILDLLANMLAQIAPTLPEERMRLVAQIVLTTGDALLSLNATARDAHRPALLAEAEVMLETYLIQTIETEALRLNKGPVRTARKS